MRRDFWVSLSFHCTCQPALYCRLLLLSCSLPTPALQQWFWCMSWGSRSWGSSEVGRVGERQCKWWSVLLSFTEIREKQNLTWSCNWQQVTVYLSLISPVCLSCNSKNINNKEKGHERHYWSLKFLQCICKLKFLGGVSMLSAKAKQAQLSRKDFFSSLWTL